MMSQYEIVQKKMCQSLEKIHKDFKNDSKNDFVKYIKDEISVLETKLSLLTNSQSDVFDRALNYFNEAIHYISTWKGNAIIERKLNRDAEDVDIVYSRPISRNITQSNIYDIDLVIMQLSAMRETMCKIKDSLPPVFSFDHDIQALQSNIKIQTSQPDEKSFYDYFFKNKNNSSVIINAFIKNLITTLAEVNNKPPTRESHEALIYQFNVFMQDFNKNNKIDKNDQERIIKLAQKIFAKIITTDYQYEEQACGAIYYK